MYHVLITTLLWLHRILDSQAHRILLCILLEGMIMDNWGRNISVMKSLLRSSGHYLIDKLYRLPQDYIIQCLSLQWGKCIHVGLMIMDNWDTMILEVDLLHS